MSSTALCERLPASIRYSHTDNFHWTADDNHALDLRGPEPGAD
jgi:hypothetical protein